MNITVTYVGSSLLAPLKNAERELNRDHELDLQVSAYNFGSPLTQSEWARVDADLSNADLVFVIHVMDGENAARLLPALEKYQTRHRAVIVINCMPELMRRVRMGKLDVRKLVGDSRSSNSEKGSAATSASDHRRRGLQLLSTVGSWMGRQGKAGSDSKSPKQKDHSQYLRIVDRLPGILRFVPTAGALRDVKHYLYLFCYFLQPTPANIRSMLLYALKQYVADERLKHLEIKIPQPETMPSVAVYHPDAAKLFQSLEAYNQWYQARPGSESKVKRPKSVESDGRKPALNLDPATTIGLLLMRPQVVSRTTKHYDVLIRAIEAEGLSVIPAISTLMDNRQACQTFFVNERKSNVTPSASSANNRKSKKHSPKPNALPTDNGPLTTDLHSQSRVSQIVSLTGFSFVGGPAMNDSEAASRFLENLNRPYRSAVSLDTQTIEAWTESFVGLNPVQAGMQIAIPEIDGATEPFVYGGIPGRGIEPVALEDRCRRFARRLRRWNRLQTAPRNELKVALTLFCFPPNKGNIGTAADLDVFPSVWETLKRLQDDGYDVELPGSVAELRELVLGGNSERFGATANVAYRMNLEQYHASCPYVAEIESEWGAAPGRINSFGRDLLIQGVQLRNVFIGIQPTFGYEGDPMRLMMARGSSPHHGFMAFYTYLSRILDVDAVVHVGTHGSLEFMPGKQVGMSGECWPDRLIGELPNIYLYSVNNPSEGSIAKRRSYAELVSYLTPPIENAGLYKDFVSLKDLVNAYRQTQDESERERLFEAIEASSASLNLTGIGRKNHELGRRNQERAATNQELAADFRG